jgi:uncharacterized protein YndB with AHSA1/START domain
MPATSPGTEVIEHQVRVAARPETVFAYFTDPVRLVRWMGVDATLDPRPGGVCRIAFEPSQGAIALLGGGGEPVERSPRAVMSGEFVVIEPHRRIVFTWGWEEGLLDVAPGSTEVEVSFTPIGDETLVKVAHRRLAPAGVAFHRAGWEHYLGRLAMVAAGRDPGPDPLQAGS